MFEQIKRIKTWFNQSINEPEIRYDTKRIFPIRSKVGKGIFIIGVLFVVMWIAVVIVAPEETIPQIREYYETQEPFQTISMLFMFGGIVLICLGLWSWFSSWDHVITKDEKKNNE